MLPLKPLKFKPEHRFVLLRDESGTIITMFALILPLMIGGLVMGMDVGHWYMAKRDLQSAVDAAALSTGYEIDESFTQVELLAVATTELERNGYTSAEDGITITLNYLPTSGAYTANNRAFELIVSEPQTVGFIGYFSDAPRSVTVRAVAMREVESRACVLALDSVVNADLLFSGSTEVNLGCVAASNSSSATAIQLQGSSVLNAETLYTAGNYTIVGGNAELNTETPPVTEARPLDDPYDDLANPTPGSCTANNQSINNTTTLSPGTYCNGLTLNANANVTLSPGTYYIDRGEFRVNGGARLTGTGVTIVLTSSTGANYATTRINGGAIVNLTAPTSGTYAGLAFYQDRRAPSGTTNRFNGGSTMNVTGSVYFPNQEVEFTGGNSTGGGSCTQIIAREITFSGSASTHMTADCEGTGIDWATVPGIVRLVE